MPPAPPSTIRESTPMPIPNRVTLDDLRTLSIGDIAALPAEQLALLQQEAAELIASAKHLADRLNGGLDLKYGERATALRRDAAKDAGTLRFEDEGRVIVADLPKRVKWDQEKLQHAVEIIRTGWGDDPADYVKVKLEVSEAAFSSWPRPVRELFVPARTVETGRPVYRIEAAHAAGREAA
jgi:hypothetical protein